MGPTADMAVRFRLQDLIDSLDPPVSQTELARRSGISLVTINGIAKNRTTRVDLETIDAICAALDVDPGELFERSRTRKGKRG